jgi:hypothetical protein
MEKITGIAVLASSAGTTSPVENTTSVPSSTSVATMWHGSRACSSWRYGSSDSISDFSGAGVAR